MKWYYVFGKCLAGISPVLYPVVPDILQFTNCCKREKKDKHAFITNDGGWSSLRLWFCEQRKNFKETSTKKKRKNCGKSSSKYEQENWTIDRARPFSYEKPTEPSKCHGKNVAQINLISAYLHKYKIISSKLRKIPATTTAITTTTK